MGADKGIHILTEAKIDQEVLPLQIAQIIKHFVLRDMFDLVILGKQAIDDDCNQTGQILAGLLNWPQATFLNKVKSTQLSIEGKVATAVREIDGGLQTLKLDLPGVFTCDLRINQPRFIPIPAIVKAKKKPIESFAFSELPVNQDPGYSTLSIESPPKRKGGRLVESVDQLIDLLRSEAKVI
jgi:electron transfer flavoprotein beta subunit